MPLFAPPPPLVGGCSLIASLRRTIRNGRLSQDSHLPCLGEYIDLSIEFQLTILQVFRCRSGRRKAEELHLCGTLCIPGVDDFVLLLRLVVFLSRVLLRDQDTYERFMDVSQNHIVRNQLRLSAH